MSSTGAPPPPRPPDPRPPDLQPPDLQPPDSQPPDRRTGDVRSVQPGPAAPGQPTTPAETGPAPGPPGTGVDDAARGALKRARSVARQRGLRPGSMPVRRRPSPPDPRYPGSGPDDRDPKVLGDQLEHLLVDRGWQVDVAAGAVMARWERIVGPDLGQHCRPVSFEDGQLTVRADSTAWATQLRYLSATLLARIDAEVGAGTVSRLRVVGPAAPTWSKGPRRVSGRGPRDTYG